MERLACFFACNFARGRIGEEYVTLNHIEIAAASGTSQLRLVLLGLECVA